VIRTLSLDSRKWSDRQKLIARHGKPFLPIAEKLAAWRELSHTHRPPDLCQRILDESGLRGLGDDHESLDNTLSRRHANLERFIEFFQRHDDPARPPADLLAELTNRAALARNLDFLATDDSSIPILTVHQSKGLEFDTVIIADLAEDEFPSYYAKRDLKLEEEKRLFYVALTRAKRHLILTSYQTNDWGHSKPPSSFIAGLS
jgi:DNA helicase-2/ATP-dependent DNA helicase PcrA